MSFRNAADGVRWVIFLVFILVSAACSHIEEDRSPEETQTRTFEFEERADGPGAGWDASIEGMKVTVDPKMQARWEDDGPRWTARGSTSVDFVDFQAYLRPGSERLETAILSPREFEIALDHAALAQVAAGEPLMMKIYAGSRGEKTFHVMARFKPAFTEFSGTTKLFVYRWLNPVALNGVDIVFRGRAKTSRGFTLENIFTDDDADPELFDDFFYKWHFDFEPGRLALAADTSVDPVYFVIVDSDDTRYRKEARITMRLIQLGVSTDAPDEVWPEPVCTSDVDACLSALDADAKDTEECGWAADVLPCLNPQI